MIYALVAALGIACIVYGLLVRSVMLILAGLILFAIAAIATSTRGEP
jgi:hypothetical protein